MSYWGKGLCKLQQRSAPTPRLPEKRWALIEAAKGQGELSVRELARRVGRDVKRVHEDVQVLSHLGLFERTASGGVIFPFKNLHIDMHLNAA